MGGGAGLDEGLLGEEGVVVSETEGEGEGGGGGVVVGGAEVEGVGEAFGGAVEAGDAGLGWAGGGISGGLCSFVGVTVSMGKGGGELQF